MDFWMYDTWESVEDFSDSIDYYYFIYESPNNILDVRNFSNRIYLSLVDISNDTYFKYIPNELLLKITNFLIDIYNNDDVSYYWKYFSEEETKPVTLRYLRLTKEQRNNPNISSISLKTSIGDCLTRKIMGQNMASRCYKDFTNAIQFGVKSVDGLNKLFNVFKQWLIWVFDHSYKLQIGSRWVDLFEVTIKKTYEFRNHIIKFKNGEDKSDNFDTPEKIETALKVLDKMKYFIEYYIPYNILSRRDNFYDVRFKNDISLDSFKGLLWKLYTLTNVHPNTIDTDIAFEFEMELYAPDYYNNIYKKYMRLRNGKVIIPPGKYPAFFWVGDKYIQYFV